jgi:hypothetical protein
VPKIPPFKDFNETPLLLVNGYDVREALCIKKVTEPFLRKLRKCSNFSKNDCFLSEKCLKYPL